ncbi:uncharacterized protein LOC125815076 [Solanum verrucosum]|uniref:uncharacterized protein LOC125815076 n=1 Tax=Solanum verrucosum TaxID=315347 RepID=UPI0020D1039B|nr:uncharacterized protein LOC125815076 [Solanum verrucosum]
MRVDSEFSSSILNSKNFKNQRAARLYQKSTKIPQNSDEKIEVGGCCRESCGSCWILTCEVEEKCTLLLFGSRELLDSRGRKRCSAYRACWTREEEREYRGAGSVWYAVADLYNGQVKVICRESNGLYFLPAPKHIKESPTYIQSHNAQDNTTTTTSAVLLWHQRLGHTSSKCFGVSVKSIRTDNDTKNFNTECHRLCISLGIVHQRTCIHTPQQNGIAKRKHKHILEVARAIKFQRHIPLRFWGHCILTAPYIINRLPTPVLNGKSPHEVLHKCKPSLQHLRVIGCLCFAKNMYISDKFQSRSVVAIHMGYSEQTKGYMLYDMKDKHFFLSRDVVFKETIFPFSLLPSTAWKLFPTTNSPAEAVLDSVTEPEIPEVSPTHTAPTQPATPRRSQRTSSSPP